MADLEYLRKFAVSDKQEQVLDAVITQGSYRKAAKHLGVGYTAIASKVGAMKKRAAIAGEGEHFQNLEEIPDFLGLKGTTTLYKDGIQQMQWIKTSVDEEQKIAIIQDAVQGLLEDIPRAEPVLSPTKVSEKLLNQYTLTDVHIGMLAIAEEGGADWNLEEAERVIIGCFKDMVDRSPPAKVGFVVNLGDWFHYDSKKPLTPTSGHVVDSSGSPRQMVRLGVHIFRSIIEMALKKHEKVVVLPAEGNHDITLSMAMQEMFLLYYENEPRVEVMCRENPYYAYKHGNVLLAFHHGHLKKPTDMPLAIATQYHKMWGDTLYRYGHTGDKHHKMEKEMSGMIVVQHQTLIAAESHTSRHGWFSQRAAQSITYHAEYGEVSRVITTPAMI